MNYQWLLSFMGHSDNKNLLSQWHWRPLLANGLKHLRNVIILPHLTEWEFDGVRLSRTWWQLWGSGPRSQLEDPHTHKRTHTLAGGEGGVQLCLWSRTSMHWQLQKNSYYYKEQWNACWNTLRTAFSTTGSPTSTWAGYFPTKCQLNIPWVALITLKKKKKKR